jgi:transcriptional repressor NrdR
VKGKQITMKCTKCQNADSKVVESRDIADGSSIRRRRECLKCKHRFTTYERLEVPYLVVIKKGNAQELFNRKKLIAGLSKAVEKRPITPLQLEELAADVERTIFEQGVSEIPSREIGEMVMERLAGLDEVAYVRFASVYRSFTDVASFEKELAKLKQKTHANI